MISSATSAIKTGSPLLYLCFTRLPLARANDHAIAIARLLLDRGADPNAHFMAGDSRYTPLVGVIGEGEEDRPPHPHRDELARLLLERGAEPYDGQVIYNIHFHGKILWWMKLMYEFSVKAGRRADWDDPEWHMLDQGGYGSGARWHLRIAVEKNDVELAEWCLAHGANPNAAPESDPRFPQRSLYEHAVRLGHAEIAELLARYGAEKHDVALGDEDRVRGRLPASGSRPGPAHARATPRISPLDQSNFRGGEAGPRRCRGVPAGPGHAHRGGGREEAAPTARRGGERCPARRRTADPTRRRGGPLRAELQQHASRFRRLPRLPAHDRIVDPPQPRRVEPDLRRRPRPPARSLDRRAAAWRKSPGKPRRCSNSRRTNTKPSRS